MPQLDLHHLDFDAGRLCPPPLMSRAHHHHEVELNYLFSGSVTYLHRGVTRRLEPGQLAIFWGAVPHSLVSTTPEADLAWITLPLATVRGWQLDAWFMRRLLEGEWCVGPAATRHRFPIAAWVEELHADRGAANPGLRFELQGCLWWLAHRSSPHRAGRSIEDAGLRPVAAMAQLMAERYQEDLTVPAVAKAAGLHPNYAMTLFRQRCGLTIRDYLAQLRVTHAQRRLLEGHAKVAEIAFESGFATLSAFYDSFTRRVGMTPSAFRAKFRSAPQS